MPRRANRQRKSPKNTAFAPAPKHAAAIDRKRRQQVKKRAVIGVSAPAASGILQSVRPAVPMRTRVSGTGLLAMGQGAYKSGDLVTGTLLNPLSLGSRQLELMGACFSRFRLVRAKVRWAPSCPTSTSGAFCLAIDYNIRNRYIPSVADSTYTRGLANMELATSCYQNVTFPVWQSTSLDFRDPRPNIDYFIQSNPGGDILCAPARVVLLAPADLSNLNYGLLYVDYVFDFFEPCIASVVPGSHLSLELGGSPTAGNFTSAKPCGNLDGDDSKACPDALNDITDVVASGTFNGFSGISFTVPPGDYDFAYEVKGTETSHPTAIGIGPGNGNSSVLITDFGINAGAAGTSAYARLSLSSSEIGLGTTVIIGFFGTMTLTAVTWLYMSFTRKTASPWSKYLVTPSSSVIYRGRAARAALSAQERKLPLIPGLIQSSSTPKMVVNEDWVADEKEEKEIKESKESLVSRRRL